jgi:hypothetical protein
VFVLYDKNEVIVYNLKYKKQVFRSTFKDATDQIVRIFFISDFEDDIDYDEADELQHNKFMDDEKVG